MIYRQFLLAGGIALGVFAQQTQAQETSAQARWQGLYGGLAITAQEQSSAVKNSGVHRYSEESATLGLYGGYNFVRDNGFAWGPDLLITGLSSPGSKTDAAIGGTSFEGNYLISPRVRAGYATDKAFFYGHLGFGISDLGIDGAGSGTDIVIGGAAGVGVEIATGDQWSARIEATTYNLDFGDRNINGQIHDLKSDVQQITIGMSRRF